MILDFKLYILLSFLHSLQTDDSIPGHTIICDWIIQIFITINIIMILTSH